MEKVSGNLANFRADKIARQYLEILEAETKKKMQRDSTLPTRIARFLVPRVIRNMIRRPKATLSRWAADINRCFGAVATVRITPELMVNCHPICTEEFSVFSCDKEQEQEMASFLALASHDMQLVDVGPHWGVFTLAALHQSPDVRVVAIEASRNAVKILKDNLAIGGFDDRVIVVNAACGNQVGEIEMLTTGAGGADYFVIPAGDRKDTVRVPMTTVDEACRQYSVCPTHLKIDVEGFEEEVLQGALETIREHRPVIFLELHGDLIQQRGKRPQSVLDFLIQNGYDQWQHASRQNLTFEDIANCEFNTRMVATVR